MSPMGQQYSLRAATRDGSIAPKPKSRLNRNVPDARDPLTGCEVFAPAVRSYPGVKCVTVADLLGGPRGPQRASPTSIRERGQETWGFLWYKAGRGWWFDAAARAPDHHRG